MLLVVISGFVVVVVVVVVGFGFVVVVVVAAVVGSCLYYYSLCCCFYSILFYSKEMTFGEALSILSSDDFACKTIPQHLGSTKSIALPPPNCLKRVQMHLAQEPHPFVGLQVP